MNITYINSKIASQKEQLLNHSLYQKVQNLEDLHSFLETHVYAVWDFMSLLKALQAKLTCTTTPWFATPNPETRYLINEIVLAEETDLSMDGRHLSHFEMYLEAMEAKLVVQTHQELLISLTKCNPFKIFLWQLKKVNYTRISNHFWTSLFK